MPRFCRSFALLLALGLFPPVARPDAPDSVPKRVPQVPQPDVATIDQFEELEWRPETYYLRSAGKVRITIEDATGKDRTVLYADDVEGSLKPDDPKAGIQVRGSLRLIRPEGEVRGRSLTYSLGRQTGTVLDAFADVEGLTIRGERIEVLADRSLLAHKATMTTCSLEHADYKITAREIRITVAGRVSARGVTLWLGKTPVLVVPALDRTFRKSVRNAFPLPSYSQSSGLQFRLGGEPISRPSDTLTYDLGLSVRRPPTGGVVWEHEFGRMAASDEPLRVRSVAGEDVSLSPLERHPALLRPRDADEENRRRTVLYAQAAVQTGVRNRRKTNIQLDRVPEVGVVMRNVLGVKPSDPSARDGSAPRSAFGSALVDPSLWRVDAEVSAGYFRESPRRVVSSRVQAVVSAAGPLLSLGGPLYARYGGVARSSVYGNGTSYAVVSPEAELNWLVRPNTMVGAAYRIEQAFGETPFDFDDVQIRHEVRVQYGFLGAHWRYDAAVKYDVEHWRAYDSLFAVTRRFDCIELGIQYNTRAQGVGLILNLLPGVGRSADTHDSAVGRSSTP